MINTSEILQTINMIDHQKLDVRTITMGISLFSCATDDERALAVRIYDLITRRAENLVKVGREIESEFGVPIVNKRISVTPVARSSTPSSWRARSTARRRRRASTSSAAIRRWCRRA